MNEFNWIQTYFAPLAHRDASLALRDDAALFSVPLNHELVVTTDTIHESVHFHAGTSPARIAQKALRVNLSDLAAMGAIPYGYLLNISLPEHTSEAFVAAFCQGLKMDQDAFKLSLLGGDTTASNGPLSITITAFGLVEKGCALKRSGATPDERLYVTGTIGDGYLGLHRVSDFTNTRYELPEPRLPYAQSLRAIATACLDISDGLIQDAGHLCHASDVGAVIYADTIPFSDDAKQWLAQKGNDIRSLLTGGDDYELLFTASGELPDSIEATEIGLITTEPGVVILDAHGSEMRFRQTGYQHF